MPSSPLQVAAISAAIAALAGLYLIVRTLRKYVPIVGRNMERPPLFQPLRVPPEPGGEDVRFRTEDGLELVGTYYPASRSPRVGVLVFCHEFLGDRWSALGYAGAAREAGFDIFTFDFRNHGQSDEEPGHMPLQWVSDRDVRDLDAALAYLRTRPDADPAGVALFGVSRGGSTAVCVAAADPAVWGVITDGAFPTHGTLRLYMRRWAEVYISSKTVARFLPDWVIEVILIGTLHQSQKRLDRKFLTVENAAGRLSPRPWLLIHGEKDTYIPPATARSLFARARRPKEFHLVPGARHNRCRELDPKSYDALVMGFLRKSAPRTVAGPDRSPAPGPAGPIAAAKALPAAAG